MDVRARTWSYIRAAKLGSTESGEGEGGGGAISNPAILAEPRSPAFSFSFPRFLHDPFIPQLCVLLISAETTSPLIDPGFHVRPRRSRLTSPPLPTPAPFAYFISRMIEHSFYLGAEERFYLIDNSWTRMEKVGKSDFLPFYPFFFFYFLFSTTCEFRNFSRRSIKKVISIITEWNFSLLYSLYIRETIHMDR